MSAVLFLQVHAHIISYLKQEMPSVFRKDNKKKNLIHQLPVIFSKIQLQHNISPGDFPDCAKMQVSSERQQALPTALTYFWWLAPLNSRESRLKYRGSRPNLVGHDLNLVGHD